ncbi:hypothetical protein [Desulfovibrio sp. ZJ200]|nr:hypothetical protein [Desulfovibrio sp. ZJ200]
MDEPAQWPMPTTPGIVTGMNNDNVIMCLQTLWTLQPCNLFTI